MKRNLSFRGGCVALMVMASCFAMASDIERKPIEYSKRQGDNAISRLKAKIESGETTLEYQPKVGYLPSLLKALQISTESQTLVFSKTSLQRNRISPRTPRALYFNDDIYIGFCLYGEVLEISVADRELGTEFYTLSQDEKKPTFTRHTESCLVCHGASATQGLPGHLIRSVYSDDDGTPILSLGSHRIDTTTPWEKRFGGWYVTGKHQEAPHLGNLILESRDYSSRGNSVEVPQREGQNVVELSTRFDLRPYLSKHSDVAAHLVLTHQAHIHNLLTKLNLETQSALYEERELNRELKEEGRKWESTRRRIRNHATDLVKGLLFFHEAPLPGPIEGTSNFVQVFEESGKRDSKGRSLKDLQLKDRMMKYPCSYLIYTESFAHLPSEAKEEVYRQMRALLRPSPNEEPIKDRGTQPLEATHLSVEDRQAIDEILSETLDGWKQVK